MTQYHQHTVGKKSWTPVDRLNIVVDNDDDDAEE